MKEKMINVLKNHAQANVHLHMMNIEAYFKNPAGIGEHQDLQEAIEIELGHIADYHDKLEMLHKFFIPKQEEQEDEA